MDPVPNNAEVKLRSKEDGAKTNVELSKRRELARDAGLLYNMIC